MTRSFQTTITNVNQYVNLWDDIIAKLPGFDPYMNTGIFYPSSVCELQIQSDILNAGIAVTVSYDGNKLGGTGLVAGSGDLRRSDRNNISLKKVYIKNDVGGALINVSITAN